MQIVNGRLIMSVTLSLKKRSISIESDKRVH